MSVSKWKWTPECDKGICVGDCDLCDKAEEEEPRFGEWIPTSEQLPGNIEPVIVTWKNNAPPFYYQDIVGEHFTGVAHYKNNKWFWYSSVTEDFLAEYGRFDSEEIDEAIEILAWMPLPGPYKVG